MFIGAWNGDYTDVFMQLTTTASPRTIITSAFPSRFPGETGRPCWSVYPTFAQWARRDEETPLSVEGNSFRRERYCWGLAVTNLEVKEILTAKVKPCKTLRDILVFPTCLERGDILKASVLSEANKKQAKSLRSHRIKNRMSFPLFCVSDFKKCKLPRGDVKHKNAGFSLFIYVDSPV